MGHGPPKLLVVNFPINSHCYVILGCRVLNVILAINIGDSAFLFNCWLQTCTLWLHMGLHCHMTKSYKAVDTLAPPPTKILATPLLQDFVVINDHLTQIAGEIFMHRITITAAVDITQRRVVVAPGTVGDTRWKRQTIDENVL